MRGPFISLDTFNQVSLVVATVLSTNAEFLGNLAEVRVLADTERSALTTEKVAAKLREGDQIIVAIGLSPLKIACGRAFDSAVLTVPQGTEDRAVVLTDPVPNGAAVH